jgi:hypothetical protein
MTNASQGSYFRGAERLEAFPALGRLVRKGSPDQLSVSDADRVREALRSGKAEVAKQYLSIIRPNCIGMVGIYVEYVYSLAPVLERHVPRIDYRLSTRHAYDLWKSLVHGHPELEAEPEASLLLETLHPDHILPTTVAKFRQDLAAAQPTIVDEVTRVATGHFDALIAALDRGDYSSASVAFETYFRKMRVIHDVLVDCHSLLIASIAELHGQKTAEETLHQSFSTCTLYEGLWALIGAMTHEETAAFLAEHLRAHFSGAAREGVTEVVEDKRSLPSGV